MKKIKIIIILSSFFFFSGIQSQVFITNLDEPVKTSFPGPDIYLDLNNDSTNDITFLILTIHSYNSVGSALLVGSYDSLYMIKNQNDEYIFNNHDTITSEMNRYYCDNSSEWCTSIASSSSTPEEFLTYGLWDAFYNKYFVIKFRIGSSFHYGWIKASKTEGLNLTVYSYAFDSFPNESLIINDPYYNNVDDKLNILSDILIYPNPARDYINVVCDKECLIMIYDLNGRLYQSIKKDVDNSEINIKMLSEGMYIFKIITDKELITKKIIKHY